MTVPRLLFVLMACGAVLGGCRQFPEVEVSEKRFDKDTPYPELVPLDVLLKEPEPEIDAELEKELTERSSTLNATPVTEDAEAANDPLLDRLDALRKKREELTAADPVIDEDLRTRMEQGITAPSVPE